MNSRLLPQALVLILLASFAPSLIHPVHATGLLFIDPTNIPVQPVGIIILYVVNVANMDPFNGWDIMIEVNNTVIQPQNLSIAVNTLTANFSLTLNERVHCINGLGTGCTDMDGPGMVHSAVEASGIPPPGSSITGNLFIISYKVIGLGPFSPVQIISSLVTADSTPVAHTIANGSYGSPSPTMPPDFLLDVAPSSETIQTGRSLNCCLVSLTSLHGFSGIVGLSVDVSPSGGLSASLNAASVTLLPGETDVVHLSISAPAGIPLGVYMVTATGTSGSLSHSDSVQITVVLGADFTFVSVIPTTLNIPPGGEGTSQIALSPLNGFKGIISLTVAISPLVTNGPVAHMDPDAVSIFFDAGTVLTFLRVSTPALAPSGTYIVTVTGTSGALSHSIAITVVVPEIPKTVRIDVKPGSDPNAINMISRGYVAVAVLSNATFDARTIEPTTVRFGPSGTEAAVAFFKDEDVKVQGQDPSRGFTDRVFFFLIQDTGFRESDITGILKAGLMDGTPVIGSDSVLIRS